MKKYGLIAAVLLLAAVNAFVLANVARNRSGYDAEVKLTERELPIAYSWGPIDKENTGLSLKLDWDTYDPAAHPGDGRPIKKRHYGRSPATWFDQAKLEAIGFDCSRPITSENAVLYYGKMLPRKTYAVLEYEGAAWQSWLEDFKQQIEDKAEEVRKGEAKKKELDEMKKDFEDSLKTRSRLFAVDVNNDPVQLRQKYPDRGKYIIAPVKVRIAYAYKDLMSPKREIDNLQGMIEEVLVSEINVPLSKRALLDKLRNPKGSGAGYESYSYGPRKRSPYYTVTLRYGKHYEPWIADIRKINE